MHLFAAMLNAAIDRESLEIGGIKITDLRWQKSSLILFLVSPRFLFYLKKSFI